MSTSSPDDVDGEVANIPCRDSGHGTGMFGSNNSRLIDTRLAEVDIETFELRRLPATLHGNVPREILTDSIIEDIDLNNLTWSRLDGSLVMSLYGSLFKSNGDSEGDTSRPSPRGNNKTSTGNDGAVAMSVDSLDLFLSSFEDNGALAEKCSQNDGKRYKICFDQSEVAQPREEVGQTDADSDYTSECNDKCNEKYEAAKRNLRKPLYVCFPNYSLPDLKFLNNPPLDQMKEAIIISPTKPPKPVMRGESKRKRPRPRSFADFESLSRKDFSHIKSFDSLEVLVPPEYKPLIQKLQSEEIPEVKLRKRDRESKPRESMLHEGHRCRSGNFNRQKRYSLQEPSYFPPSETLHYAQPAHTSFGHLPRSVTMPSCSYLWQHCHPPPATCSPMQSCCHHHHHHCCGHVTPTQSCSVSPSTSQRFRGRKPYESHSVDELAELLAMDLSMKTVLRTIAHDRSGSLRCSSKSTPSTPCQNLCVCEPILEHQKLEDIYDEEYQNENESFWPPHSRHQETNREQHDRQPSLNYQQQQYPQKFESTSQQTKSRFDSLKRGWEQRVSAASSNQHSTNETSCQNLNRRQQKANINHNNNSIKHNSNSNIRSQQKQDSAPSVDVRRLNQKGTLKRPTSLNMTSDHRNRRSLIPVPIGGQLRSPLFSKSGSQR